MKVYVNGEKGRGYLDLLNLDTYEFYEVKSANIERDRYQEQLAKYGCSKVQLSRRNIIKGINQVGSVRLAEKEIEESYFYYISGTAIYKVNYRSSDELAGVIQYKVTEAFEIPEVTISFDDLAGAHS